jgi:hypothetical protein
MAFKIVDHLWAQVRHRQPISSVSYLEITITKQNFSSTKARAFGFKCFPTYPPDIKRERRNCAPLL